MDGAGGANARLLGLPAACGFPGVLLYAVKLPTDALPLHIHIVCALGDDVFDFEAGVGVIRIGAGELLEDIGEVILIAVLGAAIAGVEVGEMR